MSSFLNDLKSINNIIPWPQALSMVNDYNLLSERLLGGEQHLSPDTLLNYETFDAVAIRAVLDQPGCMALRVYSGIYPADDCIRCVLVGVDMEGQDVITTNGMSPLVVCAEEGQRYP